ncbi:MAG: hypothetical protein RMJ82_01360 [Gemmatales bacterium]|nr:hypothetical protein [Gemmatales bacterium]
MLRIAVLYNQPQVSRDHPLAESEWEIIEIAELVAEELRIPGWLPELWPVHPNENWRDRMRKNRPDVVFNLFEGFHPGDATEYEVPAVLDSMGIPYTGNRADTLKLCWDKSRLREHLAVQGLPVAQGLAINRHEEWERALTAFGNQWPLFVKPARCHASVGIEQSNVVVNVEELRRRCESLLGRFGTVVIEEFLPGREFNISVIHLARTQVLPISEIVFHSADDYHWPVVTYDAKWKTGSTADRCTQPFCPARVEAALQRELETLAQRAFEALACRQYARIDVRLDRTGRPRILEVNPNPGYHPDAGFSRALQAAGWTHSEFTRALVRHAVLGN